MISPSHQSHQARKSSQGSAAGSISRHDRTWVKWLKEPWNMRQQHFLMRYIYIYNILRGYAPCRRPLGESGGVTVIAQVIVLTVWRQRSRWVPKNRRRWCTCSSRPRQRGRYKACQMQTSTRFQPADECGIWTGNAEAPSCVSPARNFRWRRSLPSRRM